MSTDSAELINAFSQIPLLRQYRPDDFKIEKLAGHTNHNFRLKNCQHDWVLRVPKQQTNAFIDRTQEVHNHNLAAKLGLVKKSLWRDESGLSITTTLVQTRNAVPQDLIQGPAADSLLESLFRLHHVNQAFLGELELSQSIKQYYALMPANLIPQFKPYYQNALTRLKPWEKKQTGKVPSHSDPVLQNLLFEDTGKIWIIDWEYSAMASPYWDLATLCNTARLGRAQSRNLLDHYNVLGSKLEFAGLMAYQYGLRLMTICWMLAFSFSDIELELRHLNQLED